MQKSILARWNNFQPGMQQNRGKYYFFKKFDNDEIWTHDLL